MVISEQRLNKQHNKALEIQYMVAHILHSAAASTRGTSVPELLLPILGRRVLSSISKNMLALGRSHLCRLQVLSIFHPPVRRLRLPCGFTLPHQRVINELLDILGFLNEVRRCWKH